MLRNILRSAILLLSGLLLTAIALPDAAQARGGFYARGYGLYRPSPLWAWVSVWVTAIMVIPWMTHTTTLTGTESTPSMVRGRMADM